MENVILTSFTVDELRDIFREELLKFFSEFDVNKNKAAEIEDVDQEFDIKGVAEYLKCSVMTIHNLKKDGAIPFYRLGRKVYFKKSEIDKSAKVKKFIPPIDDDNSRIIDKYSSVVDIVDSGNASRILNSLRLIFTLDELKKMNGVNFVGKIQSSQLLKLPNFGPKCLMELKDCFSKVGLYLK